MENLFLFKVKEEKYFFNDYLVSVKFVYFRVGL